MDNQKNNIVESHRLSNIELLRNLAMFMVLGLHANFLALGTPSQMDLVASPTETAVRCFLNALCICSVNLFVFISGWFEIRPQRKNVSKFIFQILFFFLGLYVVAFLIGYHLNLSDLAGAFFLTKKDWFIKSYLVLMILAPVLNAYTQHTEERLQRNVIIAFFLFEFVYGWVGGARRFFVLGYTPLHFIGLYLLAHYIHFAMNRTEACYWIRRLFSLSRWTDICIFLLVTLLTTSMALVGLHFGEESITFIYAYSSPLVVVGCVYLFLFFQKTRIRYSRVINWFGASSFAVYLFHSEQIIRNEVFIPSVQTIYQHSAGIICILLVTLLLLGIFVVSCFIDQMRLWLWNHLVASKLFKGKK